MLCRAALMLAKATSAFSTAQQMRQEAVSFGLWQELHGLLSPNEFGRIHEHDCSICARSSSHHIACVLLMAGRITDDEFATCRGEIAVGDINRDALLPLSGEAICELREIDLAGFGDASDLIEQGSFAVNEQAANEGRFPVIDRAAGDEFEGWILHDLLS
jgi:hypothetical protein